MFTRFSHTSCGGGPKQLRLDAVRTVRVAARRAPPVALLLLVDVALSG